MQEEFYAIAFRKKIYANLVALQDDIDKGIYYYNSERTHAERYCYGKTALQTFLDSKMIAQSKNVNELFDKSDNFKLPEKAESGSAGEQSARNRPTEMKKGLRISRPLLKFIFEQFLKNSLSDLVLAITTYQTRLPLLLEI